MNFMARIAKHYSVRRRKNARRWELIIRDKKPPNGLGNWIYGGLYVEFEDALKALEKWGLKPSEEDLHTSTVIRANREKLRKSLPKLTGVGAESVRSAE